jgi:hemoglobin-like flavoprotein
VTPEQIALVERTVATLDLRVVATDFYRRLFAADPAVAAMFTTDPAVQAERFGTELTEIVTSIRSLDSFDARVRALGARHRGYGVRAGHYKVMGEALLAALGAALGPAWSDELAEAWALAYALVAETMLQGALLTPPTGRS